MDQRNQFVSLFSERGFEALRIERRAPFCFNSIHLGATALRHVDHTSAKDAVDADQHGIAGFDEIDEASLHAGAAGARHGQRQTILSLKDFPQHGHALVHDLQKFRIEMADDGKR